MPNKTRRTLEKIDKKSAFSQHIDYIINKLQKNVESLPRQGIICLALLCLFIMNQMLGLISIRGTFVYDCTDFYVLEPLGVLQKGLSG